MLKTLVTFQIKKRNTFLLFIPLLILYMVIVLIFSENEFQGDEYRYIWFAKNLLKGFYSPPPPDINLWNGPGYPIFLIPFVWLKIPLFFVRLLNAILIYFSVIFFFKTLQLYLEYNKAVFCTFLFGIYWPYFKILPFILTEPLVIFLIGAFVYSTCLLFKREERDLKNICLSAFLLAYTTLTKIIFGYVILTGMIIFFAIYVLKKSKKIKLVFLIYSMALLFCVPYLLYTYSLTHKFFYWGNSGGESLYWMSSPYKNEYGDWLGHYPKKNSTLIKNHKKFFDRISNLSGVERDEALKKEALKNIINYPQKYFLNWISNLGRMLFSYPFSYAPQYLNSYFTIIPNMFIVVFSLTCIYPTFRLYKKIPIEIIILLIFGMIYFFGSSLVSAYSRQFYIIIPIIGLWLSYMFNRFIRIKINQISEYSDLT